MTWNFEHVGKITDACMEQVLEWYKNTPKILRATWQFEDDPNSFRRDIDKGMNFIGEIDGVFTAMVHGDPKSDTVIEGHLFCGEGTNVDFLVGMVTFAKHTALTRYRSVLTQTLEKHKTMLLINQRSGFQDTGIRSWNSSYRGRLLTIQHNVAQ